MGKLVFRSRRRTVAAIGALVLVSTPLTAPPANAGLLDPVTGLLTNTIGTVVGVVNGIVGAVVPTGWLFDSSLTTTAQVRSAIGANTLWQRGYTGKGIGVALVDTGVVPVAGLTSGNVVNGPDLSF